MFIPKTPKSEQISNTPFTIYRPHTRNDCQWLSNSNIIGIPNGVEGGELEMPSFCQIVSIDPSKKNYGFRIERRYFGGAIETLVFRRFSLVYTEQTINTHSTSSSASSLTESSMKGKGEKSGKKGSDPDMLYVFDVLTGILDHYQDYYHQTHYIIIERQLPLNYRSFRIFQHTLSYFLIKLKDSPLLPIIIEISPKLKSAQLAPGEEFTKNGLKKWSVRKCIELLEHRHDTLGLQLLRQEKKQDDLADTVCQAEAYFNYRLYSNFSDIPDNFDQIRPYFKFNLSPHRDNTISYQSITSNNPLQQAAISYLTSLPSTNSQQVLSQIDFNQLESPI